MLLVDDGSPDGSRVIAQQYAAATPASDSSPARTAGSARPATPGSVPPAGEFLTFVDSDDLLPPDALGRLVDTARRTGSDMVVGAVERFDTARDLDARLGRRGPRASLRDGIAIEDFLPLLRNLYTWNKLFRRDFWERQALWFREGVAYEDQPIITQLFARAGAIDVIPDVVYRYRMRDDQSSISQQTAHAEGPAAPHRGLDGRPAGAARGGLARDLRRLAADPVRRALPLVPAQPR